jgi:hypothetical protein
VLAPPADPTATSRSEPLPLSPETRRVERSHGVSRHRPVERRRAGSPPAHPTSARSSRSRSAGRRRRHCCTGRGASAGAECRRITALALKASVTEGVGARTPGLHDGPKLPKVADSFGVNGQAMRRADDVHQASTVAHTPGDPATRGDHRFAGFPAGPCPSLTALRRRWQPAHDSYRDPGGARSSVREPGSRDLATRRRSTARRALRGWGAYTIP